MLETQFSTDGGLNYTIVNIVGELTQAIVSSNGGSALTNVIIGTNVTSIGLAAFIYCVNLASITIPDSVTSIGYGAFVLCITLTSITIPDSVTSIGEYAFLECFSLASITIPNSVTYIGRGAFYFSYGLASMTFVGSTSNITSVGDGLFGNITPNATRTFTFNASNESQINQTLLSQIKSIVTDTTVSLIGPQIFIVQTTITTVINVDASFNKTYGSTPFNINPTSNSDAPFLYSSDNEAVATVDELSGLVTLISNGNAIISIHQEATSTHTAATVYTTVYVNPDTPNNPVIINNDEQLEYFLTTTAEYASINSNITISNNLLNTSDSLKTISNGTDQIINIFKI